MRQIGSRTRNIVRFVVGFLGSILSAEVHAHNWIAECDINFSDSFALRYIYQQAKYTFAVSTGLSASGQPEQCNATHLACWFYRQRCGTPGYVNVEPITYSHFHLSFLDKSLGACFTNAGEFGRKINGVCTAPADWTKEPRVLNAHEGTAWTKFWLADRVSHSPRVFDVATIRVGDPQNTQPIQFWFQTTDGNWWFWSNIGPGWWDLSAYAHDVMQVWIRGAEGALSPATITSIVIRA